MSTYPIKVSTLSFDHKNGTKSYHLCVIETADGRAAFVNRWGKSHTFGELKVHHGTRESAWKLWTAKEQEKTRGGYYPKGNTRVVEASTSAELAKTVGIALFNAIGKDAVGFLDPSFDTTGMREAEKPKTDDGGQKYVHDTARRADLSKELELAQLALKREQEDAYANNPNFGRF